jgi:hypothetical protein
MSNDKNAPQSSDKKETPIVKPRVVPSTSSVIMQVRNHSHLEKKSEQKTKDK